MSGIVGHRGLMLQASSGDASGDPHFSKVSALLHFEGDNGSTAITDVVGSAWAAQGTGALSTARAPFGTSSLYCDGVSGGAASSAASAAFAFGTGDFTIECWINPLASASDYQTIICPNDQYDLAICRDKNGSLYCYRNGQRGYSVAAVNAWTHVAVMRASGVILVSGNGSVVNTGFTDVTNRSISGRALVGLPPPGLSRFPGYIKDVRITKGVARYTASFTPPTGPFPDA